MAKWEKLLELPEKHQALAIYIDSIARTKTLSDLLLQLKFKLGNLEASCRGKSSDFEDMKRWTEEFEKEYERFRDKHLFDLLSKIAEKDKALASILDLRNLHDPSE